MRAFADRLGAATIGELQPVVEQGARLCPLARAPERCPRILEIISPAGFEQFFAELAPLAAGAAPDPEAFGELCARYALDMRPETLPELTRRFGVWFPGIE